ncbi:D-proline reductase (dithiol) PrdB [Bradyrhizobium sp. AZCC 1578]|uniref:glycine reductase n=1 Tax=Bradyrhizobium sp. AZCC 1578 TaxID=3117027 RepID=UPI002FF2C6B5
MNEADAPVQYIERTRHYYRALGYANDYVWAGFDDVPFTRPAKPLSELRIALITTASPLDFDGVKQVWSGVVSPPPEKLFTDNVAWDKESTHTNDRASFLPIEAVFELVAEGVIAGLTPRFHGVPTEYSQRKTVTKDAPEILARVRQDGADAAILCPLCPVCHQTVSLVARHLEANGIPTVIIGSALDVVEHCGVPRFYFTDFPLGNPCGHPWRPDMQREIVRQALALFETSKTLRTTVKAPFAWNEEGAVWRARYGRVTPADRERLLKLGDERRRKQAQSKQAAADRESSE